MTQHCIALLGRKDAPTDAVEAYCRYLSGALQAHDIQLDIRRVPWELHGWPASFEALRLMATQWQGRWVLVQYTALAWSSRGFPRKVLRVFDILKNASARIAVVFHDVQPYPAATLSAQVRRFFQLRTMRQMLSRVDLAVFTVPMEKLSWLHAAPPTAVFIPDGPNLPITASSSVSHNPPIVAVFGITGGHGGIWETQAIISATRFAAEKLGPLRLSVFGRHSEEREATLRDGLRDVPVQLSVEGILPDEQVAQRLCNSDLLLFVRGGISSRRGSAIAGIACGLPVVAYADSETAPPITDAGVVLVSLDNPGEINSAVVRVLSDSAYRQQLASRSRAAYQNHFSWSSIAQKFASSLRPE
jgi:hypothetical protein